MNASERFEHGVPDFKARETPLLKDPQYALFNRRILPWANNLMGATILDAGSGNGRYSEMLSFYNFDVIAFDRSADMIKTTDKAVKRIQGSVDIIPVRDGSIDGTLLKDAIVLCNPEMRKRLFKEIARILSPKGKLLIITETQRSTKINFTHETGEATFEISPDIDWREKVNMINQLTNINARVTSVFFPTTSDIIFDLADSYFDIVENTVLYQHFDQAERSEWSNSDLLIMNLVKKTF